MKKILTLLIAVGTLSSAEFIKNGDIVTDDTSDLMWQDNTVKTDQQLQWQDAINYCEALILEGYSDWRLPNIRELKSITNRNYYSPSISRIFQNTYLGDYWSSTTEIGSNANASAWIINFQSGSDGVNEKSDYNIVRCVR